MIYVSDLERVGFIFVVRSMVSRSHHKMLCNCDMMYAGRCYSAIICLYDNGKPRTLYDVLGKDKEEAKENFLYVKRMLKQYKTANTNGLGDIARSRVVLNIVSSLTSLFCFFCLAYCIANIYFYGQTGMKMFLLFLLFIMFFTIKEVRVHFLRKIGGVGDEACE